MNNKRICDEEDCKLRYSRNSPLILKNEVSMTCTKEGWWIPDNSIITSDIVSNYSLMVINDDYLLKDNDKKDRIEIPVNFINFLFN